ncbi:MAG: hypothetical protein QMC90_03875 [Dehalococcoidales bacterium]|nr:hypothetical protein [Dehalococcoidales bacterium]
MTLLEVSGISKLRKNTKNRVYIDMEEKAGFETPARIGEELRELRKEIRGRFNQTDRLVSAIKDLLNFVIAHLIAEWPLKVRMEILQRIANLSAVDKGIKGITLGQNPVSPSELGRLKLYNQRVQTGQTFSPEEATEFKQLSEQVAREYADQDWVGELLKVAFVIFAIYALGQLLRRNCVNNDFKWR